MKMRKDGLTIEALEMDVFEAQLALSLGNACLKRMDRRSEFELP